MNNVIIRLSFQNFIIYFVFQFHTGKNTKKENCQQKLELNTFSARKTQLLIELDQLNLRSFTYSISI